METLAMTTEKLIEAAQNVINKFQKALDMSEGVLVSHNLVIEVGAYTMCTNNERMLDYRLSIELPSRWDEKGVKEVAEALKKMGDDRPIRVSNYKEFYKKEINKQERFIASMKKTLENH